MADAREREARETYERFVAVRDEIDAGKKPWSVLADFFTEDAAYIDPAWGRVEGRENIREFFVKSMAGLEDWTFPLTAAWGALFYTLAAIGWTACFALARV